MRTSPEEQALLADAYQVEVEKQHLNPADTAFAIQRGLAKARAKRTASSLPIKWITAVLITVITAACFLLGPYRGIIPSQTTAVEPVQDWGVLEPFRALARKDNGENTIISAINNGYVQLVDRTVKSGIYQFTVNAVMADKNRLIVLYTAKTDDSQKIYSVVNTKMTNALTGKLLGNGSSIEGLNTSNDDQTIYGQSAIELTENQSFPEQVDINFQISSVIPDEVTDSNAVQKERKYQFSKKMNITFDLDSQFSKAKTETIKLDKPFMISGQAYLVSEVELSPLMTKVKINFEADERLDSKSHQTAMEMVRGVQMVSKTNDGQITLLSELSRRESEEGMTYTFSSNFLNEPQAMTLRIFSESWKIYDLLEGVQKDKLELKIK
ncbi:DUF4179 domain-containing protein [Paenibacillus illinoisensis]|uniref:DUF4179 domain-containing protein n=1 Tax=Paenibacillus illinoisensis TaxID=59845 RepID=UPI003017583C